MKDKDKLLPVVELSAIHQICDMAYAIMCLDQSNGLHTGRLRDEARKALIDGTVMINKTTEETHQYPEHILKASLLLGEIKFGVRYKTDLVQKDMDVMIAELKDLVGDDFGLLIKYLEVWTAKEREHYVRHTGINTDLPEKKDTEL